jgi:hypothetical protein
VETEHRYLIIDRLDNRTVTGAVQIVTKSSEYMSLRGGLVEDERNMMAANSVLGIKAWVVAQRKKPISLGGLLLV